MKNIFFALSIFLCSAQSVYSQNLESHIKAKPFEFSGAFAGNAGLSTISGNESDRTSPFHYGFTARLNFKIYGISTPLYLSYRDHSFSYGATLYKLRLNPQYKWIKLHIGDTFMKFNPYTLAGRNVRGYGVELTPGKFRFRALTGKIKDLNAFRDTLAFGIEEVETFTRRTLAANIGYGKGGNSIDLYAVQSKDPDSLEVSQIDGADRVENLVLGASLRIKPTKTFNIQANAGFSALTDLEVFDDTETRNLISYNSSTNYTYAGDVSAGLKVNRANLTAKVKYIQAFFDPLTTQYINNDLINYTFGLSLPMAKNRIYFSSSIGLQNNNLTGTKASTANRVILNLLTNIRLTKTLITNFRFTNFQQDYTAELVDFGDEFNYVVTNRNMMGALKYNSSHPSHSLSLALNIGRQTFNNVSDELINNQYQSLNGRFNIGLNFKEQNFNIVTGATYRNYNNDFSENDNYGATLRLTKKLSDKKLTVAYRSAYVLTYQGGKKNGNTLRNNARFSYRVDQKKSLNLQIGHIVRNTPFSTSFKELRSNLSFNTNF